MFQSHFKKALEMEMKMENLEKCPSCGVAIPRALWIDKSSYKVTVPLKHRKLIYVDTKGVGWERVSFLCENCGMTLRLEGSELKVSILGKDG